MGANGGYNLYRLSTIAPFMPAIRASLAETARTGMYDVDGAIHKYDQDYLAKNLHKLTDDPATLAFMARQPWVVIVRKGSIWADDFLQVAYGSNVSGLALVIDAVLENCGICPDSHMETWT